MKRFILILQFLTRIPIKLNVGFDEDIHKSIVYFPLVGLVLGVLTFLIGMVSSLVFNNYITAVIITLGSVILTGGLHIDGLGDTFDAIYSYRDKERMLEIMKDSRLGTNSLLAILFLILLKVGFVFSILEANLLWTVVFMPVVARLGVILLTYKTVTPRAKGMGNLFIGKTTTSMFVIAILYTIAMIIGLCLGLKVDSLSNSINVALSIVVIFIFTEMLKRHIYKKIDGVTGDILGCSIELSEAIYLIYIYIVLIN